MTTNKPLSSIAEKITQFFIQILGQLDPEAYQALTPYKNNILQLNTTDLGVTVYFKITENHIRVTSIIPDAETPNATLSGQFLNLLSLAFKKQTDISEFKQHNIIVTGNTHFLMALNKTFKDIDIDWEEHLSYFLGDFAAHNISNVIKTGLTWAKNTGDNRIRDLSLFLLEEIKLLPPQAELEALYQDINDIKIRVEKLEKRLNRLKQG